jgi:hypothetical protein
MSQLNVGTLNVGTTQFTGDNSQQTSAPPTTVDSLIGGSPTTNQGLRWNGSNWVPADIKEVSSGNSGARPSTDRLTTLRWNTENEVLENYLDHNTENSSAGWHAVGGRQLIAHTQRQDSWSSVDIKWGGFAGRNTKYYGYEIIIGFFEPGGGNGRMYGRFVRGDGTVDTGGGRYFWSNEWIHANDGITRWNSGTGGQSYFPLTTGNNGSYDLRSNAEGTMTSRIQITNCPNNNTADRWAYTLHSAMDSEQNGGYMIGGGVWRCPYRKNSNAYPLNGLRIYMNTSARSCSSGPNLVVSVFGISGFEGSEYLNSYPTVG